MSARLLARVAAALSLCAALGAHAASFIQMESQQGDFILQGGSRYIPLGAGTFIVTANPDGSIDLSLLGNGFWAMTFAPPSGQSLSTGTYSNATRNPAPGHPGLSVRGEGRGCNTSTGRFVVAELVRGSGTTVTSLAVDFEQHCEGATSALYGGLRINSSIPYTLPTLPPVATRIAYFVPPSLVLVPRDSVGPDFQARTLDDAGNPVAGAHVVFVGGGCATFNGSFSVEVASDAAGIATSPPMQTTNSTGQCGANAWLKLFAAQQLSFPYTVFDPAQLVLTPLPGPTIDTLLEAPFSVGLKVELQGIPMANVAAGFRVPSFGAAAPASLPFAATTGSDGIATVNAVAGRVSGTYSIVAGIYGGSTTLTVNQHAAAPPPPPSGSTALQSVTGASPSGTGTVMLSLANAQSSCTFSDWHFTPASAAALPAGQAPPSRLWFRHGLASFTATGCGSGHSVTFTVDYPESLPADAAFWRYGPTADNTAAHWYPQSVRVSSGRFSSSRVSFDVVDGGAGDDDLAANGAVSAMGGIAVPSMQDMWWSGPGENGWGLSMIQHGDALFTVIFAYDSLGNPAWYVMPSGTWNAARTAYTGALYSPRGTPFFAYDASRLSVGPSLGTATFTFADSGSAALDYTVDGASGHKSLTRQLFGPAAGSDDLTRGDMWWGGSAQNGWGIAVLQQYATLFCVWYTYDSAGAPTWYVMPGGSWTDANTYSGRIYRTTGSPWAGVAYDPGRLHATDVGAFTLHFDGDRASFDYGVEGRSGTLSLGRQPF